MREESEAFGCRLFARFQVETDGAVVAAAARKGYAALRAVHVADYRALSGRSELRLAHDSADVRLATDVLRARRARTSAYLHQLYWRYGKYLLVSASRPGTLPARAPASDEAPDLWSVGTSVYPYEVEGARGGHSGP